MDRDHDGPTARPTGLPPADGDDVSAADASIPRIDVHQHTQSLTWNDREAFDPWLRGVDATDVAEAIETYGPDRILVEADLFDAAKTDSFTMKRPILALLQSGIDPEAVRQVVYENPKTVLGISA